MHLPRPTPHSLDLDFEELEEARLARQQLAGQLQQWDDPLP